MTVIEPSHGWGALELAEVWRYRYLVWMLLLRDIKGRYRQTMLGPLWFVLGPLVRMVILSVVFGAVARLPSDGVPYPLFVYAALLPWELFASAVHRSTGSLIEYMSIISKVYCPRLVVPLAATLSGLVDFAISFTILVGMTLFLGYELTPRLLILPLLVTITLVMALGIGLWLAALAVRFRDVTQVTSYLVQFWFYVTPVAYSASLAQSRLPSELQWLYVLNPMFAVVQGFRWALLGIGESPTSGFLFWLIPVVVMFFGGLVLFRRMQRTIVDLL